MGGVEEVVQDMKVLAQEATGHERSEVDTKRPGGLVGLLKKSSESEDETKRPGGLVGLLKRSHDLEMEDKRSGGLIGLLKRSALDKRPAPKGKTRQPMKRAAPKGKTRQPMKRAAPKDKTRQPMKKFDPGFAGKRSPHERVTAEEPITKML